MFRRQFHKRIQRHSPTPPCLLRQPRNQIKTDIRNPRRTQNRRRPVNIRPPMHPPSRLQFLITKRLHPKTNPINPRRNPSRRLFLRHRLRVRLERNFRQLRNKVAPNRIHDPPQMRHIQQIRRPSANVSRIHRRIRNLRRQSNPSRFIKPSMPRNLLTNASHIRRKSRRRHHSRMEVAISALRLTKRNLHINPQRFHLSQTLAQPPLECGGLAAAFTARPTPKNAPRNLAAYPTTRCHPEGIRQGCPKDLNVLCIYNAPAPTRSSTLRFLHPHKNLPLPQPIKLAKEDPLPSSQNQFPILHKNHLTSPHHHRLSMRIRIPL